MKNKINYKIDFNFIQTLFYFYKNNKGEPITERLFFCSNSITQAMRKNLNKYNYN